MKPFTSIAYIALSPYIDSTEALYEKFVKKDSFLYDISNNPGFKKVIEQIYEEEIKYIDGAVSISARYIGFDFKLSMDGYSIYHDEDNYLQAYIGRLHLGGDSGIWINFYEPDDVYMLRKLAWT